MTPALIHTKRVWVPGGLGANRDWLHYWVSVEVWFSLQVKTITQSLYTYGLYRCCVAIDAYLLGFLLRGLSENTEKLFKVSTACPRKRTTTGTGV